MCLKHEYRGNLYSFHPWKPGSDLASDPIHTREYLWLWVELPIKRPRFFFWDPLTTMPEPGQPGNHPGYCLTVRFCTIFLLWDQSEVVSWPHAAPVHKMAGDGGACIQTSSSATAIKTHCTFTSFLDVQDLRKRRVKQRAWMTEYFHLHFHRSWMSRKLVQCISMKGPNCIFLVTCPFICRSAVWSEKAASLTRRMALYHVFVSSI